VCWKVTSFLPMKKGCLGGISMIWCLYLLDISCGDMGIPNLELLSILQLISSFSNPYTWKLPSYKTKHNSISNISVSMAMNQLFLLQVSNQNHHIYTTVATSPKKLWSKELKKKAIERQTQILAEIYQNRIADKGWIFREFSVAQIKKCITNESLHITWGIFKRNHKSKRYSKNFHKFLRWGTENCFRTATSPNLASLKLEASLGTKMK
jgi:hypothetical protein